MSRYGPLILDTILNSRNHPTAEQIFLEMKKKNPKIAQATVYNNLNALVDEGKIIRLSEAGFPDRYDNTSRHDHLICCRCGAIADIAFRDLTADLETQLGQPIVSYDLRIRYLCPQCRPTAAPVS